MLAKPVGMAANGGKGGAGQGGGKGGKRGGGNQAALQNLQSELAHIANSLYEGILNLNVPMSAVSSMMDHTMKLRAQLLTMYGVPTMPAGGAGPGQEGFSDYKSTLNYAVSKRAGRGLTKGELTYTVSEGEGGGYWCQVMAPPGILQQEYWSADVATSKRAAEHAAAKVALEAEFPDLVGAMAMSPALAAAPVAAMLGATGGVKRKSTVPVEICPKTKLMHGVQLLIDRPVAKGEVAYTSQSMEDPAGGGTSWMASVSIPAYDPAMTWAGEPASNQKEAEQNAAHAAYEALKDTIAPLEEERKAKKAKKNQEKTEEWKAKRAADKGGGGLGGMMALPPPVGA